MSLLATIRSGEACKHLSYTMMAAPDLELLKDIPGYQAILRAILKTQIQQLVEQLAEQAGEESILLTASITDGTLCHLGSTSGRDFLQGHEDLKSKFLGFCLKRHHMREEMDVETSSSPAPPHVVVNVPTKQSSHKPTPSPLRKPYQRRVGPKFAKSRIHVQPPRTEVHPVGVFRTSINGNEEDDPVIENEPGGAVTMTNSGDSDHQTVQFDNSSSDVPQPLPNIDFVESVLPIKVEDNSSLAPAASYTETETVVESADKTYREVVKIKQEPQTDIDEEVADMVYRIGAEGSQMGAADWDTSVSGLGPASDNAESGLEMDNNQTPYTYRMDGISRPRGRYSEDTMAEAVRAVLGGMPGNRAARVFAVPKTTLHRRVGAAQTTLQEMVNREHATM